MNLFIAILLEAFAHEEEEGDEEAGDEEEGDEGAGREGEGEGEGGAGGAEEGGAEEGGAGGKESREAETARSVASWAVSSGARVVPRAEGAADPPFPGPMPVDGCSEEPGSAFDQYLPFKTLSENPLGSSIDKSISSPS